MASKRPCVTEGNTPGKTASKRAPEEGSSRKSLFANQTSHWVKENGPQKKFRLLYNIFVSFGKKRGQTNGLP